MAAALCMQCCFSSSFPPQINETQLRAHHSFDQIPLTSTYAWNSLLRSHNSSHAPSQSLICFRSMLFSGFLPDSHTLPLALSASRLANLPSVASQIHALALKTQLLGNPHVLNSLVESYSHFNGLDSASMILSQSAAYNDPISWTLLLNLCLKQCKPSSALQLFDRMLELGVELDSVVLVTAAKACGLTKSVRCMRRVHEVVRRRGFLKGEDVLLGNSIVKMYLECNRIEEARAVFEGMLARDLVSWTTMINGYVKNGGINEGLKLFQAMCGRGVRPDSFAVSAILPACARMAACKKGKEIHGKIIRLHLDVENRAVGNALMDMYVKSGSIEAASKIFERMVCKDTISWTVMILGHSLHGQGETGIELFKQMKEKGTVTPDRTTFAAALHAANTACLVEEGKSAFSLIAKPQMEHHALMTGLLSRGGYFREAQTFVEEHHLKHCGAVQRAMLDGCRIHQNVRLGKRITEQLLELEPLNAENYVLLSNVYAANEQQELAKDLKETIRDMGLKTKRAYSWIEIRNKVHVFCSGDVSHPRSEAIYWILERLLKRMKEKEGYIAREDYSLHDVDEERECIPWAHSEMLAIGLGLISSSQSSGVLRVTKNLRVCRNCHDSAKVMARIIGREIILKDPDRFHHFKDGTCSCKDMW